MMQAFIRRGVTVVIIRGSAGTAQVQGGYSTGKVQAQPRYSAGTTQSVVSAKLHH